MAEATESKQYTKVGEYRGHDISLTADLRFVVIVGDTVTGYNTAAQAREGIDDKLAKQAKSRKVSLPVISGEGVKAVITGIHMGNGWVTGLPNETRYEHWYVNAPLVAEAISRLLVLRDETRKLEALLDEFVIEKERQPLRGGFTPDAYTIALDVLEREHADKTAIAKARGAS